LPLSYQPRATSREKSITEDRRGEDASKDFVGDVRSRALDGQCKVQTTLKGSSVLAKQFSGQIRSYDDSKSLSILSDKGIEFFADLFDDSRFDGLRVGR
jgi:hypothetical protein